MLARRAENNSELGAHHSCRTSHLGSRALIGSLPT